MPKGQPQLYSGEPGLVQARSKAFTFYPTPHPFVPCLSPVSSLTDGNSREFLSPEKWCLAGPRQASRKQAQRPGPEFRHLGVSPALPPVHFEQVTFEFQTSVSSSVKPVGWSKWSKKVPSVAQSTKPAPPPGPTAKDIPTQPKIGVRKWKCAVGTQA